MVHWYLVVVVVDHVLELLLNIVKIIKIKMVVLVVWWLCRSDGDRMYSRR